jgi:hypothetical protein
MDIIQLTAGYTEQQFIDIWSDEHHALHNALVELWYNEVELEALRAEYEEGAEERGVIARAASLADGATAAEAGARSITMLMASVR